VNKVHIEARKARGHEIALRFKGKIVRRKDGIWNVPSETSPRKRYEVDPDPTNPSCTCLDHQETGEKCKHLFAVLEIKGRVGGKAGATPAPKAKPPKPTEERDWSTYNSTQTNEEDEIEPLLWQLCQNIQEPPYARGRPPIPWSDQVFAATMKVYLEKSARRVMPRLRRSLDEGFLTRPVTFNTISSFLEKDEATKILLDLLVRSSLPAAPFERVFAADSTGFAGNKFVKWQDIKYRGRHEHIWAKMHAMVGISTHVLTAVLIKERDTADLGQLPELLRITGQNFIIEEVLCDKVYNTFHNQKEIAEIGARAFIPPKSTFTGRAGGAFKASFIDWNENREESLAHYGQRAQVETAFSSMKMNFGDSLRSKNELPMKNEALCKALNHNLRCLIRLMYSHKIGIEFMSAIFERGKTAA
jgi:transposase